MPRAVVFEKNPIYLGRDIFKQNIEGHQNMSLSH